jgi:hypothetical protein
MPPPKVVRFKVHQDKDGKTIDLKFLVSIIDNGFVIKAGASPFFCGNKEELKKAVNEMLDKFTSDQESKEKS